MKKVKRKRDEIDEGSPRKKIKEQELFSPFSVMDFFSSFWKSLDLVPQEKENEKMEVEDEKEEKKEIEEEKMQDWKEVEDYFLDNPMEIKWKKDGKKFLKMADHHIYFKKQWLGKGAYGKVHAAESFFYEKLAIKKEKKKTGFSQSELKDRERTLEIMRSLGELKGDYLSEDKKTSYIVMPFKSGKDLFDVLYESLGDEIKPLRLSRIKRYKIALKCAEAVQKMHAKNIIHADLKPENFRMDEKGNEIEISTIDYGFSIQLKDNEECVFGSVKGSPNYSPPEFFVNLNRKKRWTCGDVPFSKATDIYALGIMFKEDLRIDLGKRFNEKMLHIDPKKRPTIDQICEEMQKKILSLEKNNRKRVRL